MTELRPPKPLQLGDNAAASWKIFKQRIKLYLIATEPVKPRSKEQKAAIFLHVAGQEAIDVFNTLNLTPEEAKDYDALVKAFEAYCLPKCNETYERYVFRSRRQAHGEPFEQFFRDLQLKARTCNFGDLRDSMLRDQIVYGISRVSLREKLLRKKDLTLVAALEYCKAEELAESQNKAWANENKIELVSRAPVKKGRKKCRYCNLSHAPRTCPAYGKICNNCMKPNHFTACCTDKRGAVDDVFDETGSDGNFDVLEIRTTESKCGRENRDWVVTTSIEGKKVQLKVDTGAQANLLQRSLFNRLGTKQQPYPMRSGLRHYGSGEIPNCGKVRLAVQLDKS
uniref:Tick transposon n=1 Tax=Rhipicephalus zambeziensis TaxID=60191 RepID=A0A224Z9B6_9ACAR